ncbi:MAG: thioredoxin-dependent thiol peroxidase [Ignavibacteriaceae bacterium]|nr:thioredoxin-dependent thiol peroxidase [Ignavibacteriaceae bacterium]
MVKEGNKAPAFSLPDQDGKQVSLSDLKGKNVVLYFYPKDNTSGCTKEACQFRDAFPRFKGANAVIIGISPDSVESHKRFENKYELPFTLLSDEKKLVLEKYEVWKEKSMYGRKYMGVERTTFIIDKEGKIRNIFNKVKVSDHEKQVLQALKELE